MAVQAALILRLRRLIDDAGRGYSQSGPDFSTNISAQAAPSLLISLDGADPVPLSLTPIRCSTGPAIAAEIQAKIRAISPSAVSSLNALATWDSREGYKVFSGTVGSASSVRILPPTSGDNAASALKLGLDFGGFETVAATEFTDSELAELLSSGVVEQNAAGSGYQFTIDTLPKAYETLACYRAWHSVILVRLGRHAQGYRQKVGDSEDFLDQPFANYLKLAEFLTKKIAADQAEVDGQIQVSTVSRWDHEQGGQIVPNSGYESPEAAPILLAASWASSTEALVELEPIYSASLYRLFLGYREGVNVQVIDRSVFSDPSYTDTNDLQGYLSPSVKARELRDGKNVLVKISGLDHAKDYTFQAQSIDTANTRHFSNKLTLTRE